jgi:hypothetical protein
MSQNKIQFLAYYLPQFHPIPENDVWWGKGFTEWTNVAKAKPLFKGHYQPILPGELGFYDLRLPEVQEQQAQLAQEYGIDGFIYYQYWFGNAKMLLEKPAEAMLKNKNISLPFCFCWANETWKGIWHGLNNPDVLIEQTYQGEEDYIAYFNYLLPFFKDERYIKVNNKPMFHIYRLNNLPDYTVFISIFNSLAILNNFEGIYIVTTGDVYGKEVIEHENIFGVVGLDAFNEIRYQQKTYFKRNSFFGKVENEIIQRLGYTIDDCKRTSPLILDYKKGVEDLVTDFPHQKYIPCVFPNWDNSARSGKKSLIFKNSTPKSWAKFLESTIKKVKLYKENPQLIIIKSWNEWAEGNYLEPDRKFDRQWLEVILKAKTENL